MGLLRVVFCKGIAGSSTSSSNSCWIVVFFLNIIKISLTFSFCFKHSIICAGNMGFTIKCTRLEYLSLCRMFISYIAVVFMIHTRNSVPSLAQLHFLSEYDVNQRSKLNRRCYKILAFQLQSFGPFIVSAGPFPEMLSRRSLGFGMYCLVLLQSLTIVKVPFRKKG